MTKINVIDAPMGSGKSTAIINMLNKTDAASLLADDKYIIATPYNPEVARFKAGITGRKFYEPDTLTVGGAKRHHFRLLVEEGKNIVTTHALLDLVNAETLAIIKEQGYTIIIDEDMSAHERVKTGRSDISDAKKLGYIAIDDETKIITWIASKNYEGVFDYIKEAATETTLYFYNETTIIKTLSANFFEAFTEIYLLNYLFEQSNLYANLQLNGISYEKFSISQGEIVPFDSSLDDRKKLRSLINVYEGKANDLCKRDKNPFSSTFYNTRATASDIREIKLALENMTKNVYQAKSSDVMWTTLKSKKENIKGKGYTKGFVSITQKASNEYANKSVLLYAYNFSSNPFDVDFYKGKGVEINPDLFAVATLLQWIFRSRIRNGKPIELFLPSERMRTLLEKWANNEI